MAEELIKCPNCGQEIDVNELLYHQLDDELKRKYNDQLTKERKAYEQTYKSFERERANFAGEKRAYQKELDKGIREGIRAESIRLEKGVRAEIESENSDKFKSMQEELNTKSGQLKEFNKAKAEIEQLKREKDEIETSVKVEAEKNLSVRLKEETEKIRKVEEDKIHFQLHEKEQVIEKMKEDMAEMQRKAAQGSMQLQGEVQELAIEEWLASNFPLDTIDEIKKGARGADCIQIVNTRTRQNCGSIYYESKRTKDFQPSWIEKFKNDIRDKGADIGVLVTQSMPADMNRMGLRDGVWVCTFEEFQSLCVVLRQSIIQLSDALDTQENKGDKMSILYSFLTGNEFRMQVEAIVGGFTQMQIDLEAEKRSLQGIWKKREKQIEKVLLNTNYMYSSIKGIAGNAIQTVQLLELQDGNDSIALAEVEA